MDYWSEKITQRFQELETQAASAQESSRRAVTTPGGSMKQPRREASPLPSTRSGLQFLVALVVVSLLAGTALAQSDNIYVYPARGQSQAQQQRDRYECHSWAVRQTGFDP